MSRNQGKEQSRSRLPRPSEQALFGFSSQPDGTGPFPTVERFSGTEWMTSHHQLLHINDCAPRLVRPVACPMHDRNRRCPVLCSLFLGQSISLLALTQLPDHGIRVSEGYVGIRGMVIYFSHHICRGDSWVSMMNISLLEACSVPPEY